MLRSPFTMLLVVCILVSTGATGTSEAYNSWSGGTWRTTRHQNAREKPAFACVDRRTLYIVGGVTWQGNVNDVWKLDTETQKWDQVYAFGTIPKLNAAGLVHVDNGKLFLFGGQHSGWHGEASNQLFTINVGASSTYPTWEKVEVRSGQNDNGEGAASNTGAPLPRYRHALVTTSNDTFVTMFGVSPSTLFNDVWEYSVSKNTWRQLFALRPDPAVGSSTYPTRRYNPCCFYFDDKKEVICYGGTSQVGDSNELWSFSLITNNFTLITVTGPAPSPRRLAQCTMFQGEIYIYSGFSTGSGPVQDDQIHIYNRKDESWRDHRIKLRSRPWDRSGGVMTTCDEFTTPPLLMFGTNETHIFNDMWEITPGLLQFTQRLPNIEVPLPRAQHVGSTVGEKFYVFSGLEADGNLLHDTWSFDLHTETWRVEDAMCRFGGRTQATAVSFGAFIWVFGGKLSDGTFSNQLIVFDTEQQHWSLASVQDWQPEPRAGHATVAAKTHVVIFGGSTVDTTLTNDVLMYSLLERKWNKVRVKDGSPTPPPRRFHGMVFDSATNEILIIGGDGGLNTLLDRWSMSVPFHVEGGIYEVEFKELGSDKPLDDQADAGYIRSLGVVTGVQGSVFVAGGGIGTLFPPEARDLFYTWNRETGRNWHLPTLPVGSYHASGTYFKRSVYIFGGYLSQNSVKIPQITLNEMLVYTAPSNSMCKVPNVTHPSMPENEPDCLHCSLGTVGPTCYSVPAGWYMTTPMAPIEPCPPGTASTLLASYHESTCDLCNAGSYNELRGQQHCKACPAGRTCLIGSIEPIPAAEVQKEQVTGSHPSEYDYGDKVPLVEIGLIIGACGIVFGILCLYFDRRYRQYHVMHYLSPKALRKSINVFRKYTVDSLFLDRDTCYKALLEFNTTEEFSKVVVDRAMALYREKFGAKRLSEKKFTDIIILCIGGGYIEPFPGTPFAQGVPFDPPFMLLNLRELDLFKYRHREFIGNTLTRRKTSFGGMITLGFYFVILVYLTLQITQFRFANVIETRSVLPTMIVDLVPEAEMYVSVEIFTDENTCVDPLNPAQCFEGTTVSLGNPDSIKVNPSSPRPTTGCKQIDERVCLIEWHCQKCALMKQNVSMQFYFGHSRTYSSQTKVNIKMSTGIDGESSSSEHVFSVADPELLYRGFPSTVVTAAVLKTSFEDDIAYFTDKKTVRHGYHVQFEENGKRDGNMVSARSFALFTGLPVTVNMVMQDVSLFVNRQLKQSVLDLVAALLGGITGIAGSTVIVMRTLEFAADSYAVRQLQKRLPAMEKRKAKEHKKMRKQESMRKEEEEDEERRRMQGVSGMGMMDPAFGVSMSSTVDVGGGGCNDNATPLLKDVPTMNHDHDLNKNNNNKWELSGFAPIDEIDELMAQQEEDEQKQQRAADLGERATMKRTSNDIRMEQTAVQMMAFRPTQSITSSASASFRQQHYYPNMMGYHQPAPGSVGMASVSDWRPLGFDDAQYASTSCTPPLSPTMAASKGVPPGQKQTHKLDAADRRKQQRVAASKGAVPVFRESAGMQVTLDEMH